MSDAISDLRARIFERRGLPPRSRFSSELRQRLLAAVAEEQGKGRAVREIAEDLGLRLKTLSGWLRAGRGLGGPAMRRVVVEPEVRRRSPATAIVVSMGNLRIEGLDLEGVAHLLRALS